MKKTKSIVLSKAGKKTLYLKINDLGEDQEPNEEKSLSAKPLL
jgi:hypothetical protein